MKKLLLPFAVVYGCGSAQQNAGKASPTAPIHFAPITMGTGSVTGSCSGIRAGCLSESTGALTSEPVAKIVFISPSPSNNFTQLTTACQQLQVQTQFLDNSPTPVTSDTTFTFSSYGGNGDFYASSAECATAQGGAIGETINTATFHTSTLHGSAGDRYKTMISGSDQISVWYANRTSSAKSNWAGIAVSALNRAAALNATIIPKPARRISFVKSLATVNTIGSACKALTYRFDDIWGNQQNLASSSTINMSVTGAHQEGEIYSDSGCTARISSRTLSSGNQDTVYYKDPKTSQSTFNILGSSIINGIAIQAAVSTPISLKTENL